MLTRPIADWQGRRSESSEGGPFGAVLCTSLPPSERSTRLDFVTWMRPACSGDRIWASRQSHAVSLPYCIRVQAQPGATPLEGTRLLLGPACIQPCHCLHPESSAESQIIECALDHRRHQQLDSGFRPIASIRYESHGYDHRLGTK
jgi:hypothetical protein